MGIGTPELDRYEREERMAMLKKECELIKDKFKNMRVPINKYMKYKSSKQFHLDSETILENRHPIDIIEGGEASFNTVLKDMRDL